MEESLGEEPRQRDDTQHGWSGCEHHEMLVKDGGDMGGCLRDHTERQRKISLVKGEDSRRFKHDLREALGDARWSMITRKELREDAAKGIDKAASLHLFRSKQLTQWQRRQLRAIHMSGIWT